MELSSLDVIGYKNQQVPNTFIIQPTPTQNLGIVLPGYRHSADRADLHYAGRILLEQGADLLRVEYAYYRTDFMEQPDSEQDKWISSDVFAICNTALSHRSYNQITLVGKSLGTIAMGHLLADSRFQNATCVWLTPLLTVAWLRSRIEEVHPRSLFIIGTADKFYKPDILKHLENVTKGRAVVIEGARHGLEITNSISKSLSALNQIVQALQEFLNEGANRA
ncbi:MAG: alpha/beta family hydrolase [Pseudomonadota bacterium]